MHLEGREISGKKRERRGKTMLFMKPTDPFREDGYSRANEKWRSLVPKKCSRVLS